MTGRSSATSAVRECLAAWLRRSLPREGRRRDVAVPGVPQLQAKPDVDPAIGHDEERRRRHVAGLLLVAADFKQVEAHQVAGTDADRSAGEADARRHRQLVVSRRFDEDHRARHRDRRQRPRAPAGEVDLVAAPLDKLEAAHDVLEIAERSRDRRLGFPDPEILAEERDVGGRREGRAGAEETGDEASPKHGTAQKVEDRHEGSQEADVIVSRGGCSQSGPGNASRLKRCARGSMHGDRQGDPADDRFRASPQDHGRQPGGDKLHHRPAVARRHAPHSARALRSCRGPRPRLHRPRRAAGAGPGPLGACALRATRPARRDHGEDKVLDAGGGTGYSTAVLAALSEQTVALETDAGPRCGRRGKISQPKASPTRSSSPASSRPPPRRRSMWSSSRASSMPPPPQLLALLREGGRLVALIGAANAPPVATAFHQAGRDRSRARPSSMPSGATPAKPDDEAFVSLVVIGWLLTFTNSC